MFKRILIILSLLFLISISSFSQKDSIKTKHQVFLSFNVGLPVYNNFVYRNESRHLTVDGKSKRKSSFNFGLEHNVNHFTFNLLINYFQNELIGEPFGTFGNYIYSANSNQMNFKTFEVYQVVKYNYLQAGIGFGYNHWIKKHNIAITTNLQKNIFTKIIVSTNFTDNAANNNQDTSQVVLPKNFEPTDIKKNRDLYLNMKLTYTYALLKKLHLSLSLNVSYGLLNTYSPSVVQLGKQNENSLNYSIFNQKLIFGTVGVRYKLF
jgi:hypothetical protein